MAGDYWSLQLTPPSLRKQAEAWPHAVPVVLPSFDCNCHHRHKRRQCCIRPSMHLEEDGCRSFHVMGGERDGKGPLSKDQCGPPNPLHHPTSQDDDIASRRSPRWKLSLRALLDDRHCTYLWCHHDWGGGNLHFLEERGEGGPSPLPDFHVLNNCHRKEGGRRMVTTADDNGNDGEGGGVSFKCNMGSLILPPEFEGMVLTVVDGSVAASGLCRSTMTRWTMQGA